MKVIIVGATGLVGGAVLRRAIQEPAFTSIIALTRRELPEDVRDNAKVETVLVKDFSTYNTDVLVKLKGAGICIWAMGGRLQQFPDAKTAHLANVDYLLIAAKVFADQLTPALEDNKKFRFVYCSGSFTERDPKKKLLFLADSRKLKGEAESGLLAIENQHSENFEVFIVRPGGVLETDAGLQNTLFGSFGIGKGYLGCAMVDIAVNGASNQVTESSALRAKGRTISKAGAQDHK